MIEGSRTGDEATAEPRSPQRAAEDQDLLLITARGRMCRLEKIEGRWYRSNWQDGGVRKRGWSEPVPIRHEAAGHFIGTAVAVYSRWKGVGR